MDKKNDVKKKDLQHFCPLKNKFGASPQLECWNNGIMGSGIMRCWVNGKICVDDKIKNG
jgi:hypothetical protein